MADFFGPAGLILEGSPSFEATPNSATTLSGRKEIDSEVTSTSAPPSPRNHATVIGLEKRESQGDN